MDMSDINVQKVVTTPCAACKMLRRRCCPGKCILAPYFPPNDTQKFEVVHRVFGASNVIKMVEGLPMEKREDAVTSMVYEANARLRDPVYGCTGAICQLLQQLSHLQLQIANAQAELLKMHLQQANRVASITDSAQPIFPICDDVILPEDQDTAMDLWEPLWAM